MFNPGWHKRVPPRVVACALVAVVVAGTGAALLAFRPPDAPERSVRGPLPPGTYPAQPLPAGTLLPALKAEGWVNGPAVGTGHRLVVVDIWAHWCPGCRATAPGLVRAYHRFKERGVAFVSLTNVARPSVEEFVSSLDVPWPAGYGADLESIAALGAYSSARMGATYNPGYEVSPTLYLLDANGRVLWHDDQARPRHTKDAPTIVEDLVAEIERALGPGPKK
ncbi:thiol-disulfide oxidoreductase [Gemmata sp. SH-PL17]|uniref:peroxiredoxin family protein n=1 Tax=Gemmata sp. SH-PL17 TaxID=1630693 RepID=UPI00078CB2C3|nr:TlpA disulfide reductase family protein [Gemmata sp. SH-PL17]AMV25101.1 thiol-disulfide oxidoreductase [Gemmata sp. SH-PL17]